MSVVDVAAAEQACAEHGLTLDWGDEHWPLMRRRILSLRVERDGRILARAAQTYCDEAGKERALSWCLSVVYERPARVD